MFFNMLKLVRQGLFAMNVPELTGGFRYITNKRVFNKWVCNLLPLFLVMLNLMFDLDLNLLFELWLVMRKWTTDDHFSDPNWRAKGCNQGLGGSRQSDNFILACGDCVFGASPDILEMSEPKFLSFFVPPQIHALVFQVPCEEVWKEPLEAFSGGVYGSKYLLRRWPWMSRDAVFCWFFP